MRQVTSMHLLFMENNLKKKRFYKQLLKKTAKGDFHQITKYNDGYFTFEKWCMHKIYIQNLQPEWFDNTMLENISHFGERLILSL